MNVHVISSRQDVIDTVHNTLPNDCQVTEYNNCSEFISKLLDYTDVDPIIVDVEWENNDIGTLVDSIIANRFTPPIIFFGNVRQELRFSEKMCYEIVVPNCTDDNLKGAVNRAIKKSDTIRAMLVRLRSFQTRFHQTGRKFGA